MTAARDAVEVARLQAAAGALVDADGLPQRARRAVAVATHVGAPVGRALDGVRAAMRDLDDQERAIRVATAQGHAIAVGLVAAPFLLVPLLGTAAGVDVVTFYRSAGGLAVGAIGGTLLAVGGAAIMTLVRRAGAAAPRVRLARRWRRLAGPLVGAVILMVGVHPVAGVIAAAIALRRPMGPPDRPAVEEAAELMAIASAGGVGTGEMFRLAAEQVPELEDDLRRIALAIEMGEEDHAPADLAPLVTLLRIARALGAPVADALVTFASEQRARRQATALAAAARLPAQLTVPTVLFLLPATLLLVGAPLVAGALASLPT